MDNEARGLLQQLQTGRDSEKIGASRRLWNIASEVRPGLNEELLSLGIVEVAVGFMRRTDNRKLQEEGALLLRPMCWLPEAAKRTVSLGAPHLCVTMMQCGPHSRTAGYGAGLLVNLTSYPEYKQAVLDAGALPLLLTLLFADGNHWEHEQAADVLSYLAKDSPQIATTLSSTPNLIPRLIALLTLNQESDGRAFAAKALDFIAKGGEDLQRMVIEGGAIQSAATLISPDRGDEEIQWGAHLFATLVQGEAGQGAIPAVMRTGAIERLIYEVSSGTRSHFCARVHSGFALRELWLHATCRPLVAPAIANLVIVANRFDDPNLQQQAAEGFCSLIERWNTRNDCGLRNAIAQSGAISPLIGMLSCPQGETARFAACALNSLAEGGDNIQNVCMALGQAGAIKALMSALGARDKPKLQLNAAECLNNLLLKSMYNRDLAMQANIVPTLMWVIKEGATHEATPAFCIDILVLLVKTNPEYKRHVLHAGALPVFENVRKTGGSEARDAANTALAIIKGGSNAGVVKRGGWCFCFPVPF